MELCLVHLRTFVCELLTMLGSCVKLDAFFHCGHVTFTVLLLFIILLFSVSAHWSVFDLLESFHLCKASTYS